MAGADHVLLTRFNLPSEGMESAIRSRSGWLEERVRLFETYCLPSVIGQRGCRPGWIVYFDPDSPDWLKEWIDQASGPFTPLFRRTVPRHELLADLDQLVARKSPTLITTNLDNDDGLSLDFSARILAEAADGPRSAVYFKHGLIKSELGLYRRTDRTNAFCSVRESWEQPLTSWADWHNRLSLTMPVQVIGGSPAWLQVVHGTNVSNRVRGRLVSPTPYAGRFMGLDDLPLPTRGSLLWDRIGPAPLRAARDGTRTLLRKSAVQVLGKDGFTALKSRLAGWFS